MKNIEKIAFNWIHANKTDAEKIKKSYYCPTRDIFQARLDRILRDLLEASVPENDAYVLLAIAGEIGNNSFDHNLGNWPDIMGIYFCFIIEKDKVKVVLADRGQGILKTLKAVRPGLQNDRDALKVAFTEKISGRAPENRGNGLKFVRENVENGKMVLDFYSGNARARLNNKMEIVRLYQKTRGCLAILELKL